MPEVGLDDMRQRAVALLEGRVSGVRVRSLSEFSHMDDTVFYAEAEGRAFNLCVVSDVDWSIPVNYYAEGPDDMRNKTMLMVDVANGLDGNEGEIVELYNKWFGDDEGAI